MNKKIKIKNTKSGAKFYYLDDTLHREDGPAVEFGNGDKHWYKNDKLHREDGPAIEYANNVNHWYLNGIRFSSEKEFEYYIKYMVFL